MLGLLAKLVEAISLCIRNKDLHKQAPASPRAGTNGLKRCGP